ncbi:MAG: hypothetical protein M3440_10035 [Chloroflexota bacterium]|nr:hypothetical protein [Chloroflexota bacterium]
MTTPTLPTWWPPSGYEALTEAQVRELFAYLRTVVPPVMADARRRIQARVGDDPIQVWPKTVKQFTGRRLGYFNALKIVQLSARTHDETVSVAIGIRADGRLATLESTPERRQQEWQLWEGN